MKYIMALDQGTTSSRCILFDHAGNICASVQKEFRQIFPQPGWVEHNAAEIWDTTLEVSRAAMDKLGVTAADIAAIGITNQRETSVIWDKATGEPIANAIVWQCRRTAPIIDKLVAEGYGDMIREKTGLVPDAYFSGSKIKWLLDNVPGARERAERGELLFGTIDTWLIWKLTGGRVHVTDYTNASRTMLFNIHELCWDKALLELLDIPESLLPEVKPSSHVYGKTEFELYGGEIPIAGAGGDQQCALFGQCCFEPGTMKNTYGTGCFMLMNTGREPVKSVNGLVTSIAVGFEDHVEYALEGSVFVAGAVVQWLRDELGIIQNAAESEDLANSVPDSAGVVVVPAFTGLGAPYWDSEARGAIFGLTRGANRAHIARAALESMAYQVADVAATMERESGHAIDQLNVDGGASANGFLMQFQADILNAQLNRPKVLESTGLGAAFLAGLSTGFWEGTAELRAMRERDDHFRPAMIEAEREEKLANWHAAVSRVMIHE